jgi:hypothetical protein
MSELIMQKLGPSLYLYLIIIIKKKSGYQNHMYITYLSLLDFKETYKIQYV